MARRHLRRAVPPRQTRTRTRQNRGALVADPATNTKLLSEQLRELGLYAAPTLGDGNCLFRALSDQYYGSPSQHLKLREEICDWMAAHRNRYEPFVDDDRGFDEHLRCMRQPGTYGGHLELSAFAHLKRRDVKVIQPGLVYVIEWAAGGAPSAPSSPVATTSQPPTALDPPLNDREARRARRAKKKELKEIHIKANKRREDDDDSDEGPAHPGAVYVAYHDWEHFSSVRNLTGPHMGLPYVMEKPAPALVHAIPTTTPSKQRSKAKANGTSRALSKVAHAADDDEDADIDVVPPSPIDIPLPASRSTSPTPSSVASVSGSSILSAPPISNYPEPVGSPENPPNVPRLYLRIRRSPKRSLEESSGTSSQSHTDASQGLAKRLRSERRRADKGDADADADTPSLFASDSSSSSEASSPAPSTPPSMAVVPPSSVATKPLTRQQRRALGLPKPRKTRAAVAATAGARAGADGMRTRSAGKIVIPLKQLKNTQDGADGDESTEAEEGTQWRKNGSGRLDVRGFKELKI